MSRMNLAKLDLAIDPPEVIAVPSSTIHCDGGGGPLGHPRVYYDMGGRDHCQCQYCGRLYVLDTKATPQA